MVAFAFVLKVILLRRPHKKQTNKQTEGKQTKTFRKIVQLSSASEKAD